MSDCRFVDRHAGTLLDGELDPASMIAIERHVDVCAGCQERVAFERRSRAMVRESVAAENVRASDAFRARITAALAAEPAPMPATTSFGGARFGFVGYGGAAAMAAAMLLFAGGTFRGDVAGAAVMGAPHASGGAGRNGGTGGNGGNGGNGTGWDGLSSSSGARSDGFGSPVRPMLEDVVRLHSNALPADVPADSVQQVPAFFRGRVAFPVRPAQFDRRDVRFLGARYANVNAQGAVALYYDVGGARVTVVVYEAPADASTGVRRVRLGQAEMLYHDIHGHAVPVRSQGDLQYAFTGDLDRRALLELAAGAHVSP